MPFSIYDKLPASPLPTSPFEFLAKLAEGQKQDLDKLDERIANTQGLFAKLVPAKGHEGMTARVSDKYNQQLTNLMDKYGNNPLSREFSRELTSLATTFAQDSEVRKIVDSRDFYEKNAGVIEQEKFKGSLVNAPGILDDKGDYSENETLYSWDSFNVTPFGDSGASIRTIYNILRDNKMRESGITPKMDANGKPYWEIKDIDKVFNNEQTRAETAKAILNMTFDPTRPDPGLNYLRANAEKLFPNDKSAQEDYAMEYIKTQGIPFNVDWRIEDARVQEESGSTKKGGEDEQRSDVAKVAVATTVGLDYITNANGERIITTPVLEHEATAHEADIQKILSSDNLRNTVSTSLFGADGNLLPNAIETSGDGYQLINTELISDPIEKQTASDYNMQLMSLQTRQASALQTQAYFMEKAGYRTDMPIEQQVSKSILVDAQNTALERIPITSIWSGNNFLLFKERVKNTDGTINKNKFENELKVMINNGRVTSEKANEILNAFDKETSFAIKATDPKYKQYSDMLEGYLGATVYTEGYNYSISKSEEQSRIRNLLGSALLQRKITRANFGPEAGDLSQTLGDKEIEALITNVLEKTKDEDYDFNQMSIRFDDSTGEFVLDLALPEATYEIAGFDQEGLGDIVRKQDPQMSNAYLIKKSSLVTQLDASNGRRALVEVPIKDNNNNLVENNRIIVKTAFEQHGTVAKIGDFLFCLPEAPDKVFVAKNSWAVIQMTDLYREAKQAGKSENELKSLIADGMSLYSITAVPDRQYNIGAKYFPTPNSKYSPSKIMLDKQQAGTSPGK